MNMSSNPFVSCFFVLLSVAISLSSNAQVNLNDKEDLIIELIRSGETDSALVVANTFVNDAKNQEDKAQVEASYLQGIGLIAVEEYDSARSVLRSAEAKVNGDKLLRYKIKARVAYAHQQLYQLDSLKLELDFLMEHEEEGDSLSRAMAYFGMYQYYYRGEDKDIALKYIQRSREIFAALGDHKRAATFDAYIGRIYEELDNDSLAEVYQNSALTYHLENENLDEASYIYLERGSYYNGREQWDKAESDLLECIRLSNETGNLSNFANANQFLASTYTYVGRYEEAEQCIDASMVICEEYDIDICRVYAHMHYADLFLKSGDYDRSIYHGELLVSFPKEFFLDEVYDGYGLLSQAYAAKGNFQRAYETMEVEMMLSDSLFNIENQEALGALREEYEREKNMATIRELEAQAEIDELKQNGLIGGIAIVVIMSLITLNREIKRRKNARKLHQLEIELKEAEEERLKEELRNKNRELTAKALQIAQKNEVLSSLQKQLEDLAQSNDEGGVRSVVNSLKLEKAIDGNWEQFTQQFTELNPNFYQDLIQTSPKLSKNDLRLAALLRMNLSSKEIARILNISDEGVKKARQRFRKKLELNTEDSLEAYVLSI
ncbi:helix-turn-helix transcriptional regulator [Sanyastnella coralliicola]|uniref:helix-turn-helix transcriptional regulator n=1 Tax=Sanyastnella coralliicola TaxID=3069118 RepID=UPI0027BAF474|nr:helix-turn-helix transcriptional regulator [Longitalea sp. SCSIO 12813]